MDPVPFEVKVVFHVFGGMGFILGTVLAIFTSMAAECVSEVSPLYIMLNSSMQMYAQLLFQID